MPDWQESDAALALRWLINQNALYPMTFRVARASQPEIVGRSAIRLLDTCALTLDVADPRPAVRDIDRVVFDEVATVSGASYTRFAYLNFREQSLLKYVMVDWGGAPAPRVGVGMDGFIALSILASYCSRGT